MTCEASKHGVNGVKNHGCTCTWAKAATARYEKHRRCGPPRTCDPTEATSQLRDLAGQGWSLRAISARTGITPRDLYSIRSGRRTYVHTRTAGKIGAVHAVLDGVDGGDQRATDMAWKMGWLEPIDLSCYLPADVAARDMPRGQAVDLLTVLGWSAADIGDLLGITERSVTRRRAS